MNRSSLTDAERAMVRAVVGQTRPSELGLADDLMRPPARFRWRPQSPVGFGADVAVDLIAPYAIIVTVWVLGVVGGEVREVVAERLRALTRQFLDVDSSPEPPDMALPVEPDILREAVIRYALQLRMDESNAELLADAVLGAVARAENDS